MHDIAHMHTCNLPQAAQRPATAVALVVGGVALFAFMAITVKTMLGMGDNDFEYLTRGI
jgi:hypothetical protein